MIEKVPCGGFYVDNETLKIEDNVLSAVGGGGGGSDLPAVTSDDAEKILRVNVDWEADPPTAEWGKGLGLVWTPFLIPGDYGVSDVIDSNYWETMLEIYDNGGMVIIIIETPPDNVGMPFYLTASTGWCSFDGKYTVTISDDGEITDVSPVT